MKNNEDVSKMAVVYARYSSSGQREESIEGQLAAAHKYAEAKGYTIIHEYCDRAKTGTNDNREAFQQMLTDTGKHQFSVIIVWKVDRFGRNREEITFNKYRAKKNGVHVEYVAENIPEGNEGIILESVLEGMAEYFSRQLSQNVKRGLMENAKKHKAINGTPPLGYRLTPKKYYEIDPETAPLAKLIFEKYASGETLFSLIQYLNDQGYKTSRGKPYGRSSLDKMLRNEKYIGTYVYKDIRDEDAIPALIDKTTFYKVQEMLKTNKRAPSRKWHYTDYLLTGKLFCGHCGASMVGRAGHNHDGLKYSYYYCMNQIKHECNKKPVRQEWIEEIVIDKVNEILDNSEIMEMIIDATWELYMKEDTEQAEKAALQAELTGIEKSIANLVRSIEAGIINDMIKKRMDELEGQRTAIKTALAEIELSRGPKLTRDHIAFFIERFREMDRKDRECQKKLVEVFVNAVFLYDDHLKIAFNFTDPTSDGNRHTITLSEIDDIEMDTCKVRTCPPKQASVDSFRTFIIGRIRSVFILSYELPPEPKRKSPTA